VTALVLTCWIALADAGAPADAGVAAEVGVDAVPDAGAPPPPPPPPAPKVVEPARVRLTGRVLSKGTRRPLGGASISIDAVPAAEADFDGNFEAQVLPGRHRVQVQHPGFEPLEQAVDAPTAGAGPVLRLMPRLTGERYETVVTSPDERAARTSLREEELTQVAGSLGDPFRVIESLPGVSQVVWPLAIYAIRGANPGNTGFFMDGVRVPLLFHFALGPSVIHPFFLQQVDFYPGGYPVRYGRYISGIVTARTQTPPTDQVHASADVRLFDSGGIVAAPWDGGAGTLAVAGRISYTGLIFSALAENQAFNYWDYQVRGDHRLGPGRLTLFAFGSYDLLRSEQSGNPQNDLYAELTFHRVDLRWEGGLGGGRLEAGLVVGQDKSDTAMPAIALPFGVTMLTGAPRLWYTRPLAWWADLEVGADGEAQRFRSRVDPGATELQDLFRDRDAFAGGGFLGFTFRSRSRLVLSPAMRYDIYDEQGVQKFEPSPRLTARFRPGGDVWLKAHLGRFSQSASLPLPVPGFDGFGLKSYGVQTSYQGSVGVEAALGGGFTLDASGFYQRLSLTDLDSIFNYDPAESLLERREGESYGGELMIRRAITKRLYGWLAYTLSWSDRLVGFHQIKAPSDWDQRHILNLVLGYRMRAGWSAGGRIHFNTGRPYPVYDDRNFQVEYQRLPPFFQLDVRLDKRFVFDRYMLSAYIELVNSTLTREVFDLKRKPDGTVDEKGFRIVLPSVGVHAEW
jgi:hypothetical protein